MVDKIWQGTAELVLHSSFCRAFQELKNGGERISAFQGSHDYPYFCLAFPPNDHIMSSVMGTGFLVWNGLSWYNPCFQMACFPVHFPFRPVFCNVHAGNGVSTWIVHSLCQSCTHHHISASSEGSQPYEGLLLFFTFMAWFFAIWNNG